MLDFIKKLFGRKKTFTKKEDDKIKSEDEEIEEKLKALGYT